MQDRVDVFRRVERQYLRDRLGDKGLQVLDSMVIRLLARLGRMRQEDIVHKLVLDKSAVARTLARLEEAGLVERAVSDHCRREKLVALTQAGLESYQYIECVLGDWKEICYRGFSTWEREQYDAFLSRITDNVTQYKWSEEEREETHG